MMRTLRKLLGLAALGGVLLVTGGCGGGGGGGTTPADPGNPVFPTPPAVSASGLAPSAPSLGPVLQTDAASLRPFKEGASWRYRGLQQRGAQSSRFETTTVQSAVTVVSASERATNPGNIGSSETTDVQVVAGEVFTQISLDMTGKGHPGAVKLIELRSPVRTGDQIVMVDSRYTDTTIDVDNDGAPDAIDFAAYAQVIGVVAVDLPNLGTLQAVRVDVVLRARVRPSSSTTLGPVVESVISNYYVPGVGLVRSTSILPFGALGSETTEELLVAWDGVTSGLGAMAARDAVVPLSNSVFPGQTVSVNTPDLVVASFVDHALVFTGVPGSFGDSVVSKVDRNGVVVNARLLPGYSMHSSRQPLVHAGGVVFFEADGGGDSHLYTLTPLDREGAFIGSLRGVSLNLTGNHFVNMDARATPALAEDGTLWVFVRRMFRDLSPQGQLKNIETELVLRRYGLNGNLLGPEHVLADGFDDLFGMQWRVVGNSAFMAAGGGSGGNNVFVGTVDSLGNSRLQLMVGSLPSTNIVVQPFKHAQHQIVLWSSELGTGQRLGAMGGVQIGPDLMPLRKGSTWLDEQLPWMPAGPAFQLGSRVLAVESANARLWPNDTSDSLVSRVGWVDMAESGALASRPARSVRFAGGIDVNSLALFDDRVLVFGGNGNGGLQSTVVWLPTRQ